MRKLEWPGYAEIVGVIRKLESQPSSYRSKRGSQIASNLAGAFMWNDTPQGFGVWDEVWTNLRRFG